MTRTISGTVLALTLLGGGVAAQGPKPHEPEFQGRNLASWIEDLSGAAPYTRNRAAYAISSMGPAARSAVPALIKVLKEDPEAAVRYPVCVALREIGPDAKEAVPALTAALDDRNDDVASMARKALTRITGKDPRDEP